MTSENKDSLTSFPVWIHLFVYCLVALVRTFRTMFNRSGKSRHQCLIPDIRGKTFSLSLSMMLALGFL